MSTLSANALNRLHPVSLNLLGIALAGFCLLTACHPAAKNSQGVANGFDAYHYSSNKKVLADSGAVVSAHPLASKAGLQVLRRGGNAFDAAIATQLALAVVYPIAGNLGGGGFLVGTTADGKQLALDYRETAPGAASRDMYIDSTGAARTDLSQDGHLATGVPGTVAGLFATARYGRLPFAQLIAPAIELAEKGFAITENEAGALNGSRKQFDRFNTVPSVFQQREWKTGDTLIQADLAATLKRIRDEGQDGFYRGKTAELIAAEMKRGHGLVNETDLKDYQAKERKPHVFLYKGYQVIGMPMPSSGGLLVHQMMKMIEPYSVSQYGFQSAAAVQVMIEAERRAFADRSEYMGDADFFDVPAEKLADSSYLAERMSGFRFGVAGNSEDVLPGVVPHESPQTTHLSVIDREGNTASVTTTLNGLYGSKVVVGGAGFFLNNEMDDFSIKPGVANMFGAIGGDANAIRPGKRMLSSMTPTVVLRDGRPFLVLGTPGGTTIPTSVFQSLVNVIEFNMTTEDALYKPKFHHQWLPDEVLVEPGFNPASIDSLRAMGYRINRIDGLGRTEIIRVLPDGRFEAVADNRGEDAAEGY